MVLLCVPANTYNAHIFVFVARLPQQRPDCQIARLHPSPRSSPISVTCEDCNGRAAEQEHGWRGIAVDDKAASFNLSNIATIPAGNVYNAHRIIMDCDKRAMFPYMK